MKNSSRQKTLEQTSIMFWLFNTKTRIIPLNTVSFNIDRSLCDRLVAATPGISYMPYIICHIWYAESQCLGQGWHWLCLAATCLRISPDSDVKITVQLNGLNFTNSRFFGLEWTCINMARILIAPRRYGSVFVFGKIMLIFYVLRSSNI